MVENRDHSSDGVSNREAMFRTCFGGSTQQFVAGRRTFEWGKAADRGPAAFAVSFREKPYWPAGASAFFLAAGAAAFFGAQKSGSALIHSSRG